MMSIYSFTYLLIFFILEKEVLERIGGYAPWYIAPNVADCSIRTLAI